jgi:hypothetical protein
MLNVHIFESVPVFLRKELVIKGFFQIDSLYIKKGYCNVDVTFIANGMVTVLAAIVYVYFLVDYILRSPHFAN